MKNITESRSFKWSVAISIIVIIAYIITWRFRPVFVLSLIIFPGDLVISIIYFIVSIRSAIFWIVNRRIFKNTFVPLIINIVPIVLIICGPSINRNKSYYKETINLKNTNCNCHLYIESYLIAGGFLSTDIDALYLTDSVNFRLYEGTYDEGDGGIATMCKGDSVSVDAYVHEKFGPNSGSIKTAEKKTYSLKELKKSHRFE